MIDTGYICRADFRKIAQENIYCMQVRTSSILDLQTIGFVRHVIQAPLRYTIQTGRELQVAEGLIKEFGSSGHLRKYVNHNAWEVKSIKMSSQDKKVQLSSPSKWHEKMSRMPSDEFKNARKKFSLQKVKGTYRSEPTGHGTEDMSSMITQEQEYKSSVELKYNATCVEYKNQNLCKKEPRINFPGSNLCADAKPETEINLPIRAVLDASWCGSLEIIDKDSCSQFYDGFLAHLPGKVRHKVIEYTQLMPNVLPCTVLPSCNVWEEIFQNESPTIKDIALFFFPGNFERSKEQYFSLVRVLEMQDLVLRSLINGVNLLIFSSKRIHLDSCGLKMKSFLWGLYCPLQLTHDSQAHSTKVKRPLSVAGDAAPLTT